VYKATTCILRPKKFDWKVTSLDRFHCEFCNSSCNGHKCVCVCSFTDTFTDFLDGSYTPTISCILVLKNSQESGGTQPACKSEMKACTLLCTLISSAWPHHVTLNYVGAYSILAFCTCKYGIWLTACAILLFLVT